VNDDATIIDAHAHLGFSSRFSVAGGDVGDILRLLRALRVRLAICSHQTELQGEWDRAREEIMEAYSVSEGCLLAYTVFNPWQEDSARWVAQRLAQGLPYVGIKIHPAFHELSADDEAYRPAWELAAEHEVPLLAHTWDRVPGHPAQAFSFPSLFAKWLEQFPRVTLIMGHAGGRPGGHRAAGEMGRRFANVYMDLAGDSYGWRLIEWLVEQVGAERVLFATDFTWMDPRTHLGRVLAADLSPQARQLILSGNAVRLFRLQQPRPKPEEHHEQSAQD